MRLSMGLVGKQLGYGDLRIFTGSGEGGADTFRSITQPAEFRNAMMARRMEEQSGATRPASDAAAPAPASAAPANPAADAADTIRHLAELRDQGHITPEEFEAKKAEVLARI